MNTPEEYPKTPEEIAEFDRASNHPYECKCKICLKWWAAMPEED